MRRPIRVSGKVIEVEFCEVSRALHESGDSQVSNLNLGNFDAWPSDGRSSKTLSYDVGGERSAAGVAALGESRTLPDVSTVACAEEQSAFTPHKVLLKCRLIRPAALYPMAPIRDTLQIRSTVQEEAPGGFPAPASSSRCSGPRRKELKSWTEQAVHLLKRRKICLASSRSNMPLCNKSRSNSPVCSRVATRRCAGPPRETSRWINGKTKVTENSRPGSGFNCATIWLRPLSFGLVSKAT